MRYLFCLLTLFCFACQEKAPSHALYHSLEGGSYKIALKVDSVISLARKTTPFEHYVIVCWGAKTSNQRAQDKVVARYLEELGTLPFPEVKNKADGFLLMSQFAYGAFGIEIVDVKALSSLLFDMENKFDLTPEERYNFLTLKAGIYIHLFREYESGTFIIAEAADTGYKAGIKGKKILPTFNMLFRCHMYLHDQSKPIKTALNLLDTINSQLDDTTRQIIYNSLSMLYYQQKEYEKAYDCFMKSAKKEENVPSDILIDILLKTNRIPVLKRHLDKYTTWAQTQFKGNRTAYNISFGKIAWAKSNICLLQGDTNQYQHQLLEAIYYYDQESTAVGEVVGEISETYARLLWKQGKHEEAIHRMETLTEKITKDGPAYYRFLTFNQIKNNLIRLRLLADYYIQAGRGTDAFRQLQLYDSLKTEHTNTVLREEKRKNANYIYTSDLHRNLDLRTAQYKQERQKWFFMFTMFGFAVVIAFIFGKLYYRRQKELNRIYIRQRKMEQMEALFTKIESVENPDELPADKQLYLRLQKQMYEEKLFLKPDFSRNDLCRLVGSNRMYVSTCINKYAEMNLNQWINKARVNYAIYLIHSGETDLQKLAQGSGFSSISTFYRSFKYFTLLSPKQYIERETQQKISDAPSQA